MVSRRVIVPVLAATAVAAVLVGVSQFGRAPGIGAAQARNRTPLPVHNSPGMPWPVTTVPMPPACTISGMRATVVTASARHAGSVIVLRLRAAGRPCSLSTGGWPAVRLELASGKTPVAKAYPYRSPLIGRFTAIVTFLHGRRQRDAVVLGDGRSADIVLLSARVPGQACYRAAKAMIFPTIFETGASLQVPIPAPAYQCSTLETLMYLSARIGRRALALGQHALAGIFSLCQHTTLGRCRGYI